MIKRLKILNVDADIMVVDNGTSHGFLNMQTLTDETHDAFVETLNLLKEIIRDFKLESRRSSLNQNDSDNDNENSNTIKL